MFSDKLIKYDENEVLLKESEEVYKMKMKVAALENEVSLLRVFPKNKPSNDNVREDPVKSKKCDLCEKTFMKNCELEMHLKEHLLVKEFECDVCRKGFYLKWRLKKQQRCQFLQVPKNNQLCPYDDIVLL